MDDLVSSLLLGSGTFAVGAFGAYRFGGAQPAGSGSAAPAPREGDLPRVAEVRVRCKHRPLPALRPFLVPKVLVRNARPFLGQVARWWITSRS